MFNKQKMEKFSENIDTLVFMIFKFGIFAWIVLAFLNFLWNKVSTYTW